MTLAAGAQIEGKYLILAKIGEGAAASVYKAEDRFLERVVAIKVMHSTDLSLAESRKRFEREAIILSRLDQKNIVSVLSAGFLETGQPFIVMEFVAGRTLALELQRQAKIDPSRAAAMALQLCDALEHAHAAGVIHRDLSPRNIIIIDQTEPEQIKILDFGLSKLLGAEIDQQKLTATGTVMGTLKYMSPEQCSGRKVDHRSDIYSLGCILYECASGHPPFDSPNPMEILQRQCNEVPAALRDGSSSGQALKPLELIISMCLQKDPDHRFQTYSHLKEALNRWLTDQGETVEEFLAEMRTPLSRPRKLSRKQKIAALITLTLCGLAAVSVPVLLNNSARNHKQSKKSDAAESLLYRGSTVLRLKNLCKDVLQEGAGIKENSAKNLEQLMAELRTNQQRRLAHLAMGKLYEERRNFEAATAELEQALSFCGTNDISWKSRILQALSACAINLHRPEPAEAYARQLLKLPKSESRVRDDDYTYIYSDSEIEDNTAYRLLARAAMLKGQYAAAIKYCDSAARSARKSNLQENEAQIMKADAFLAQGQKSLALAQINQLSDAALTLLKSTNEQNTAKAKIAGLPRLSQAFGLTDRPDGPGGKTPAQPVLNPPVTYSDALGLLLDISRWYWNHNMKQEAKNKLGEAFELIESNHLHVIKAGMQQAREWFDKIK